MFNSHLLSLVWDKARNKEFPVEIKLINNSVLAHFC